MKNTLTRVAFIFLFSLSVISTDSSSAATKPPYTLYDFYADWCGPCQEMMPHIKAFEEKHKDQVSVKKVDIDKKENNKLSKRYTVTYIPRLVLLNAKGNVLADIGGSRDEKELDEIFSGATTFETEIQKLTDEAIFEKAQKLLGDKKYDVAFPYVAHLAGKNPKEKKNILTLSHVYFEAGDYERTLQIYGKISGSKEFKQDLQSQYEYAISLFNATWEEKSRTKAKDIIYAIEKIKPDFPGLHYGLGISLRWREPKEAMKEFLKELEKNPTHRESMDELIYLYEQEKKWDEAIDLYKKMAKLPKKFYWGNYIGKSFGLGRLYLLKGEVKKAMMEYRKAATTDLSSYSYLEYGEMLELAREEEKAKEAFEKVAANTWLAEEYLNQAKDKLERLKRWEGKRKKIVFLGIQGETLTKENAGMFGLPEDTHGLFIRRTYERTQADYANLQAGDVIQKINGKDIKSFENYEAILQGSKLGEHLTFEILRDGKTKIFFLLFAPPGFPYIKWGGNAYTEASKEKPVKKKTKRATFWYRKSALENKISSIVETFNEAYEDVSQFFKEPEHNPFSVYVYPSVAFYGKRWGDYSEGVSSGGNYIYLADSPFLKETLVVLLTYALAEKSLGYREADILSEGLAGYLSGTCRGKDMDALAREAYENKKVLSLEDMTVYEDFLCLNRLVSLPVSASFVKYLIENYEWDNFKQVWKNSYGSNFKSAFKKAYNESLQDAEKKWLEKIGVKTATASACGETEKCSEAF